MSFFKLYVPACILNVKDVVTFQAPLVDQISHLFLAYMNSSFTVIQNMTVLRCSIWWENTKYSKYTILSRTPRDVISSSDFSQLNGDVSSNFVCLDLYSFSPLGKGGKLADLAIYFASFNLAHSANLPEWLYILPMFFRYFLARSAKVAERAICFTDRNFFF